MNLALKFVLKDVAMYHGHYRPTTDRRSGQERRIDGPDGYITSLYEPIDHDTPLNKQKYRMKYLMKYEEKRK